MYGGMYIMYIYDLGDKEKRITENVKANHWIHWDMSISFIFTSFVS